MQSYQPFGLRPAYSPHGVIRPGPIMRIASAYNENIFQYGPIAVTSSTGLLVNAAAGARALGTFQGVEFTDLEGRRRYSNRWLANTVLPTDHDLRAYISMDQPGLVYEIQANDTLDESAIGRQFDWSALAGNTLTGLSSVGLNVASLVAAGSSAGLRVIGLSPGPDNAWGDPFPVVFVQIAEHQFVADKALT